MGTRGSRNIHGVHLGVLKQVVDVRVEARHIVSFSKIFCGSLIAALPGTAG